MLCELVKAFKGESFDYDTTSSLMNTPCVGNIQIALNELKACITLPNEVFELHPEDICHSPESLFKFIRFLRTAFEKKGKPRAEELPLSMEIKEDKSFNVSPIRERLFDSPFQVNIDKLNTESINLPLAKSIGESNFIKPIEELMLNKSTPRLQCEDIMPTPKEDRPLQITNSILKENTLVKKETVSEKVKEKLLMWMEEIGLIKHGAVSTEDFPGYCRNGILISDLILRLEGVFFTRNIETIKT